MSKAKLIELTTQLDVQIDYAHRDKTFNVSEGSLSAPQGKHFGSTGHRASCFSGNVPMTELWRDMLDELRTYGLETCNNECRCDD
jgi:hypothetical protein